MEPAFLAEGHERAGVVAVGLERVPVERHREVFAEGDQGAASAGGVGVGAQVLLLLGARDLADVGEQVVEGAELLQQFRRRLDPDAGDARHVVDRVAGQRQQVHHLFGGDPPVGLQPVDVEDFVLAQVEDADAVGQELPGVLVGGADEDVEVALGPAPGEGRDHVVGLEARLDQDGDAERLEQPLDDGDLRAEVLGHLLALALVVGEDLGAEDRPAAVERRREIVGLAGFQEVQQVSEDAEDRVRRPPIRPRHQGDRVEDLIDQGIGVEDVERRAFVHRGDRSEEEEGAGPWVVAHASPPCAEVSRGRGPGVGRRPPGRIQ